MKEQLLLLLKLQDIDSRVHEIRQKIQALPEKLATANKDLAMLQGMLDGEQAQIAETESWRKEQESLIQQEDEAIRKAKTKLQSVKNAKDYSAANREIDNKRRSKSEREEELLRIMEALDKTRAEMESHAKDVDTLRQRLAAEKDKATTQIAELEVELASRASGRDELVAQIDERFLKAYEQVKKKRDSVIVAVISGVCEGCHITIPPQLNNILARFDSMEMCPGCHRLLYRKDLLDEARESGE